MSPCNNIITYITFCAIFIFSCINLKSHASDTPFSISFGPVQLGESRVPVNLRDFKVISTVKKGIVKANFIKNSIQWVRTKNNLLTPRARLVLRINQKEPTIFIKYQNRTIIPEKGRRNYSSELYINLFGPGTIELYDKTEKIGTITVRALIKKRTHKTQVIDYSCSRFNLKISGLDSEYFSIGCRLERQGQWKKGTPRLEITWTATNFKLPDGTPPPYTAILHYNKSIETFVVDGKGNTKKISISATLPKRLRRLKIAVGLGPYIYNSKSHQFSRPSRVGPTFMLYGKLDLTNASSLRIFDALIYSKSIFNNAGLYFAYGLAEAFDGRLEIVPLLGLQELYFKYNKSSKPQNSIIYPQGVEFVWKHAFGKENYTMVFGTFLSPSSQLTYKNIWLRWGKKLFWELNFIDWKEKGEASRMYGLSIGLPLASFF